MSADGQDSALETGVGVVLPNDNRTRVPDATQPPFRWIGQITSRWPDGSTSYGSGALYGERYVLTCAHNFLNRANRSQVRSVNFAMGRNRSATGQLIPGVSVPIRAFRAPAQYLNAGGPPPPPGGIPLNEVTHYLYDIAVALIGPDFVPDPPGESGFVLGPVPGGLFPARMSGYSGDLDPTACTQYRRNGQATLTQDDDLLIYDMSTYGGDSGAPVYSPDLHQPTYHVLGVHVSGVPQHWNFAVPMYMEQVQLVQQLIDELGSAQATELS